jgi:hypothetical protein
MADREFIHVSADIGSTLRYALESGMHVMVNCDQPEPRPCMLSRSDVDEIESGDFSLFFPGWVHEPFQMMRISSGQNRGRFFVQPRVNFVDVSVFFNGERIVEGRRRLGSCIVSSHSHWLELPGKIVRPAPPDVEVWFRRIVAHLSSGRIIQAGVHRYNITKGVINDPSADQCLPPFDFIPWGNEVLHPPRNS